MAMLSNHRLACIRLRGELAFAFVVDASLMPPKQVERLRQTLVYRALPRLLRWATPATRDLDILEFVRVEGDQGRPV